MENVFTTTVMNPQFYTIKYLYEKFENKVNKMVGKIGLEPMDPEGGWVTATSNCRYATSPLKNNTTNQTT